jgi:hypothetical protein
MSQVRVLPGVLKKKRRKKVTEPAVVAGVFGNACIMGMLVSGMLLFIVMNARYTDNDKE